MPAGFQPGAYDDITIDESVEVSITLVTAEAVAPAVQVEKTAAGLFTFTNGGAAASGGLEIYFRFH